MSPPSPFPTLSPSLLAIVLLSFHLLVCSSSANLVNSSRFSISSNSTRKFLKPQRSFCNQNGSLKLSKLQRRLEDSLPFEAGSPGVELQTTKVIITGNSTILSKNRTFELGFFSPNGDWYLGIWYASISPRTYIWVANREKPIKNITFATLEITENGRLEIKDSSNFTVWNSSNDEHSMELRLLENGNLVLLTREGKLSWQSFDFPTDTWLPGMNLTGEKGLTSWRSPTDPSPGLYSLRLNPGHGEFELLFNGTQPYWGTGNWTGKAFANVPEMMVPYIYQFYFDDPFTPAASFGFSERPLDTGLSPPLTRFEMHYSGRFQQYTWSQQAENWNRFWTEPDNPCQVFGLCGKFGVCNSKNEKPCECLSGFVPVDELNWDSGDFSGGCLRLEDGSCEERNNGFEQVGILSFEGAKVENFNNNLDVCKKTCLDNCSCVGVHYNERTNLCQHLFESLLNLRNSSSDSVGVDLVYLRVEQSKKKEKKHLNLVVLAACIVGSIAGLGFAFLAGLFLIRKRRKKGVEEDSNFPVLSLRVFSYKELHQVTRGFSEKIGHGGFGTVFQGMLSDSTIVAVKRLERPSSGEKEFRAEVCTMGNIQHVNLVRLRGFCSENAHRLLVYDFMPNGPLSVYMRKGGLNLNWEIRFRVAIGMAKGLAYLHEECRDCIIHCDIKPENILLDSDYTAKVSDFGLARLLGRDFSRVLATMRGTWGYVAPEWISGVPITTKADVYSYGMTLIELIGGRRNVETRQSGGGAQEGGGTAEKWFFPPWAAKQIIEGNVAAVIDDRLGSSYDVEEAKRVALVAVWCIQDDEASRPTMGTVVKMLEGVVEVEVPQAPRLLQALVSGESFNGVKVDSGNGVPTGSCRGVSTGGSEVYSTSLGNASSPVNTEHANNTHFTSVTI
ncbi:hypothetical protein UlMin_022497 [Ulmus minor]